MRKKVKRCQQDSLSSLHVSKMGDKNKEHAKDYSKVVERKEKTSAAQANATELTDNVSSENEEMGTRNTISIQNRKKKKSGGFQSMGLSFDVIKGVLKKGYKVPTPIQRKAIPLIIDGKDVVAMARTGSGKTAAFLLPMFEKLKKHDTQGVRALILSPTRELALQTSKFTRELGKFTGLKSTCILGGDKMENQFAAMHENPDIIIATPGRFMHIAVEMELKLNTVEYVVFDEADRLFEMGFAVQLQEIIRRLPDARQTLLFSATLPKSVIEFARAGLNDPSLIRLDVDTKVSDQLKMNFFLVRYEDKTAFLLYLLENEVKPEEQTVIFTATKHHVEFIKELLMFSNIQCSYIYSSMDPTARKINIAKFQKKKVMVMVVTDIAARGIDIPMLDNVINYDFPAKSKLFVHRVGRVARAGRSGRALSIVTNEELPYALDLHLFLGRPLKLPLKDMKKDEDAVLGTVPQDHVDEQDEFLRQAYGNLPELASMKHVMENACKQYVKSRPLPSSESVNRSKEILRHGIERHPCFDPGSGTSSAAREDLLSSLRGFKPNQTIFEARGNKRCENARIIMNSKRKYHENVITKARQKSQTAPKGMSENTERIVHDYLSKNESKFPQGTKDEYYIPHRSSDFHVERGLEITSFEREAASISIDIVADDQMEMKNQSRTKKWDRKRKRFVGNDESKSKKVKTESGTSIPASYKSNIYKEWIEKSRLDVMRQHNDDGADADLKQKTRGVPALISGQKRFRSQKNRKGLLKSKDQILKGRWKKQKQEARLRRKAPHHSAGKRRK